MMPTRASAPKVSMDNTSVRIGHKTHAFPIRPGDVLPNGAIMVAERNIEVKDLPLPSRTSIVLAINPGTFQPYVVWKREVAVVRETKGLRVADHCFNGDYTRTIEDATRRYVTR